MPWRDDFLSCGIYIDRHEFLGVAVERGLEPGTPYFPWTMLSSIIIIRRIRPIYKQHPIGTCLFSPSLSASARCISHHRTGCIKSLLLLSCRSICRFQPVIECALAYLHGNVSVTSMCRERVSCLKRNSLLTAMEWLYLQSRIRYSHTAYCRWRSVGVVL